MAKFHFDNIFAENPPATGRYRIWLVGHYAREPCFVCGRHRQQWPEISYCVSGKAQFFADGQSWMLSAGDVIFTKPGCIHDIRACGEAGIRYYYLTFSLENLSGSVERKIQEFFAAAPQTPVQADRAVAAAFQDIFRNILNRDEFSLKLTEDAVRKLLVWTIHSFRRDANLIYLPQTISHKNRLLSQMCAYLDESVADIHALQTLPERFGYSYSYLSAVFSKAMGMSMKQYFRMRRHERACELLQNGCSVTQTAAELGDHFNGHLLGLARGSTVADGNMLNIVLSHKAGEDADGLGLFTGGEGRVHNGGIEHLASTVDDRDLAAVASPRP